MNRSVADRIPNLKKRAPEKGALFPFYPAEDTATAWVPDCYASLCHIP